MKHTPGPWIEKHGSILLPKSSVAHPKHSIALVNTAHAEYVQNCALIAAAPDLLAALSALIDAATEIYDGQAENYPELAQAVERACRAYNKATV